MILKINRGEKIMRPAEKNYLNKRKGTTAKIYFLQNLITEKNIHIRFIENELKNYRKKKERLEEQIKQLIYMNQCLRIDMEELK